MINIQKLYRPVQPTVRMNDSGVMYREQLPATELREFICCYWELKNTNSLQIPFCYRVVADGCFDIFFTKAKPGDSFVMGFCKKHTEFLIGTSFHFMGIRFFPAIFPTLTGVAAHELTDRVEKLDGVFPKLSRTIESTFSEADSFEEVSKKLDSYFALLFSQANLFIDQRFLEALHIILKDPGSIRIQSDLVTGLSPRQLRRYFQHYVGDTPKTFSQVVRFQKFLMAGVNPETLRKTKAFFDVGYYDQAHFIKEFKHFFGATPTRI